MNRAGRGGSRARRSEGPAALACWLAAVLTALFVCVSSVGHHDTAQGPMVQVTVVAPTGASASSHRSMAAMPDGCPAGGTCCASATHHVGAVVSTPPQLDPVVLPQMPCAPRPTGPLGAAAPQTGRAVPSLHVLQVLRT
ncbi:hypothetical protein OOK29_24050 [Streptomyces phaeochromogenes]|uniref:hypothetical protein n=1 Tax=Streptomyces phaeochromogenes TaxID=1923 RepID=UPI0022507C6C|nr:hypothetical protein [Streptomyces phaeochromogenes]MCX5601222.1 hypothetical protein [Streptomyces phaeochromogenes]